MATAFSAKGETKVYGPVAEIGKIKMAGFDVPDAWMLTGLSLGGEESIDICRYFREATRIFTFGLDQRSCEFTATFTIMLGEEDCNGGGFWRGVGKMLGMGLNGLESFKKVISELSDEGIHKRTSSKPITVGPLSLKGWVVTASAQAADPAVPVAYGRITCLVDVNSL